MEDYLKKIYYDAKHPASFGGVKKLYFQSRKDGKKYTLNQIKKWLRNQETYTLFRRVLQNVKRSRVISPFTDYQWDCDCGSMGKWKKFNKGYAYFLLIIDIFSRFVWTVPLETLTGVEMVTALKTIFTKQKCQVLRSDGGTEFNNRNVKAFLRKENVKHVVTKNETKANFAERAIKSIKSKVSKQSYYRQTREWIQTLGDVTEGYNKTIHRSIGMTPTHARTADQVDLWKYQYGPKKKSERRKKQNSSPKATEIYKFKKGDTVRVSVLKWPFLREYQEGWSHELFTVVERNVQQGIAQYTVKGYDNKGIDDKRVTKS